MVDPETPAPRVRVGEAILLFLATVVVSAAMFFAVGAVIIGNTTSGTIFGLGYSFVVAGYVVGIIFACQAFRRHGHLGAALGTAIGAGLVALLAGFCGAAVSQL